MVAASADLGPASARLPYLDGYRAVAATVVVAYHVVPWAAWTTSQGRWGLQGAAWVESLGKYGVSLFFLLSGLVLYRPYVASALARRPPPETLPYYCRRVLRIYPAWVIALTVWYLLAYNFVGELSSWGYLWQYTLLDTHVDDARRNSLGIAWTLSVEVTFYLVLPLIAAAIRRLPGGAWDGLRAGLVAQLVGVASLILGTNCFRFYVHSNNPDWSGAPSLWLLNFLDWFALGMLLAIVHVWHFAGHPLPRPITWLADRPARSWGLAVILYWARTVVMLPVGVLEGGGDTTIGFALTGLSAFLLLLPAVIPGEHRRVLKFLDTSALVFLGTISYGIYLWHLIILRWTQKNDFQLGTAPLFAFVMLSTVAVAFLSYHLIERPVQRLGRPREAPRPVHVVVSPTGPVGG